MGLVETLRRIDGKLVQTGASGQSQGACYQISHRQRFKENPRFMAVETYFKSRVACPCNGIHEALEGARERTGAPTAMESSSLGRYSEAGSWEVACSPGYGQTAPYRLSSGPNRSGGGGGLLTS